MKTEQACDVLYPVAAASYDDDLEDKLCLYIIYLTKNGTTTTIKWDIENG